MSEDKKTPLARQEGGDHYEDMTPIPITGPAMLVGYDAVGNTATIAASVASNTPFAFYSPDDAKMIDFVRYLVRADPRIGELYTAWRAMKKLTD